MNTYTEFSTLKTPQSQPILGESMEQNNAGGFSYTVDKWQLLKRFLILGTDQGTFYARPQPLTIEAAKNILDCIKEDGKRTVNEIVSISESYKAATNDPAIFALALCTSPKYASEETRKLAFSKLMKVCRIPTHLFKFVMIAEQHRGWGSGLKHAVANWYKLTPPNKLVYFLTKYKRRGGKQAGFSHRDLLKLSHPKNVSTEKNTIFRWAVGKLESLDKAGETPSLNYLRAVEDAATAPTGHLVNLINTYKLPLEVIPSEKHNHEIYGAILKHAGIEFILRNLGVMTANNTLIHGLGNVSFVYDKFHTKEFLEKLHPIKILAALLVYKAGSSYSGTKFKKEKAIVWKPITAIIDALNDAFRLSFETVEPSGKRILLAIDTSGSMNHAVATDISFMNAYTAAGAIALITAATEKDPFIMHFNTKASPVNISAKQRLDDVIATLKGLGGGGTNCASPITYATEHKIPIDIFVIYTDSETWQGDIHPTQALDQYRKVMGIDAKLAVVAMAYNRFSVGSSENDPRVLQCVGLSTDTPAIISMFARGEV